MSKAYPCRSIRALQSECRDRPGPSFMGGTLSAAEVRLALRLLMVPLVDGQGSMVSPAARVPGSGNHQPSIINHRPATAISQFEAAFAQAVEASQAVSFGAGRVALWAILRALGIGAGDEVVVPGYTCVAVPNAVRFAGARPVYADIDAQTFNVSAATCSRVLTSRTRAVVVAHTYGLPAPMAELRDLVEGRGIALIEDAAHALGSRLAISDQRLAKASPANRQSPIAHCSLRPVGSLGDAAFFSTEHSKMISTALGGVATTSDPELAERLRAVQAQCPAPSAGRVRRLLIPHLIFGLCYRTRRRRLGEWLLFRSRLYRRAEWATPDCEHEGIEPPGYRWRMGEAQARLGLEQLRRLEGLTAARRSLAKQYAESMRELGLAEGQLTAHGSRLTAHTPAARVPGEAAHGSRLTAHRKDGLGRNREPGAVSREPSSPCEPCAGSREPPLTIDHQPLGDRPVFVRFPYLARRREALLAEAERQGLELGLWFEGPIHPKQTNLAAMGYTEGSCPVAEQVSRRIVNLPCHPGTTPEDVARYMQLLSEVER